MKTKHPHSEVMVEVSGLCERDWADVTEHIIPASTFQNDSYTREKYFFLKTGRATSHNQLAGGYCKQSGKDLYDFLVQYTPAGIYEQLVRLIISRDITCDNYCAEILGMDKAEVRNKAKEVELGELK